MKNPPTPAGIEPATFRFVAQHLNHYATAVSNGSNGKIIKIYIQIFIKGKSVPLQARGAQIVPGS